MTNPYSFSKKLITKRFLLHPATIITAIPTAFLIGFVIIGNLAKDSNRELLTGVSWGASILGIIFVLTLTTTWLLAKCGFPYQTYELLEDSIELENRGWIFKSKKSIQYSKIIQISLSESLGNRVWNLKDIVLKVIDDEKHIVYARTLHGFDQREAELLKNALVKKITATEHATSEYHNLNIDLPKTIINSLGFGFLGAVFIGVVTGASYKYKFSISRYGYNPITSINEIILFEAVAALLFLYGICNKWYGWKLSATPTELIISHGFFIRTVDYIFYSHLQTGFLSGLFFKSITFHLPYDCLVEFPPLVGREGEKVLSEINQKLTTTYEKHPQRI